MSENKYLHGTFIDRIDPELRNYLHGPQTYGPYYPSLATHLRREDQRPVS